MTIYMIYYLTMIKLNIHEIKTHLSKYIELVEAGETVTICKRNVPVAEIRAVQKKAAPKPVLGSAAGIGTIRKSFYEPMSQAELAEWQFVTDSDPLKNLSRKLKKRSK